MTMPTGSDARRDDMTFIESKPDVLLVLHMAAGDVHGLRPSNRRGQYCLWLKAAYGMARPED